MLFLKSVQSVLTVILMMALGFFLKKFKWFGNEFSKGVSTLVVKIALPSAIFMSILHHLSKGNLLELSKSLIYPLGTVIISYIIGYIAIKVLKIKPGRRGIFLNAVANANTIFVGMPLNLALFGVPSIPFFLVCYVSNTISTWAFGIFLIANDNPNKDSKEKVFNWKKVLSPPLIGFILGVIFLVLSIPVPTFIGSALSDIGGLVTPLSLIYIGIILCDAGLGSIKFDRDTVVALIGRFILCPLIIIGLIIMGGSMFGSTLPTLMKQTFIVQSATPMLAVLPILASEYNCDVEYATNLVTSSTVLFVIVIPILMQLTQFIK
ncbi:AEC family transporter [Clostridium sp.]|uniref:AEC family transporter n=1 Tax=Clostridium sp. TaxID=1506 RepID=UPI002603AFC8|nr:AEC family transporter [Clostridium sp.]